MKPRASTRYGNRQGSARIDRPADLRNTAPRDDGKVYCPQCLHPCALTPSGSLRKHNDDNGIPCWNKATDLTITGLVELPPVHVPMGNDRRDRLPYGECRECGKPLPGERRLCGACAVRLNGIR